jgi:DNA (cytosine-5)-methyltransferase 1
MSSKQNGGAIRFIDLFSGIGGFRFAAEEVFSRYGLPSKCVFSSDIDPYAREAYNANFGEYPSGDITQVNEHDIPDHDILFAGFPCQPFSIIVNGKGFDDTRGTLFFDIARILAAKKPKAFILENVKRLIGHNEGKTLKKILHVLREELGYTVYYKSLNALDYGLPQKRERVVFVGFYQPMTFHFPPKQTKFTPLSEILEKNVDSKYYASERIRQKRWEEHTPAVTPSIWHENKAGHISSYPFSCALRAGASYNYLLVNGERRLTPREMLRLQGFPDIFKIAVSESQTRKQAGNAVPVNIIRAVFESFLPILLHDMSNVNLYPNSTYQIALAHILREHRERYQQIPSLANS